MRIERLFGLWMMLALIIAIACAQPFTYQGFLKHSGNPANGIYDFRFSLWTAPSGGTQIGPELYVDDVSVQNGLFTVQLDFGAVWDGSDRYLEILVRLNDAFGYRLLAPRVKITPTPYAAYAAYAQRPWQTVGSAIFYTSGNVGIGTSTPAARLSLGGGDANTKLALWQGNSATDVMGFGIAPNQFRIHLHNPTNRFSFLNAPSGDEIVTILGNGNVGIGTSSPSVRLSLGGGNAHTKLAIWDGGSSGVMGFGIAPNQFRIHLHNPTNRFSFLDAPNGNEIVTILGNGNVGIGASNPQARLHVDGTAHFTQSNTTFQILPNNLFGTTQTSAVTLDIINTSGVLGIWDSLSVSDNLHVGGNRFTLGGGSDPTWSRVEAGLSSIDGSFPGYVRVLGANGNSNVVLAAVTGHLNNGSISVHDGNGALQAHMYVEGNGAGTITADVKLFRVPDPDDATRDIYYGCIEGPELAMYVRGTARLVNGRARIELPDHFRKLADEQGMTVQLTPLSPDSKGLCVVRKGLDGIEVAELLNGRGNYEFDWEVKAVRKEHRDFQVYRSWDEVMPAGVDPAQAWAARLKSIQDRQARQSQQTNARKEVNR